MPRLWSFLSRDGNGVELFFSARVLHLCLIQAGDKKSFALTEFLFEESTWYFVALTLSNQSKISLRESEIRLYVDGVPKQKTNFKYPVFAAVRAFSSLIILYLFSLCSHTLSVACRHWTARALARTQRCRRRITGCIDRAPFWASWAPSTSSMTCSRPRMSNSSIRWGPTMSAPSSSLSTFLLGKSVTSQALTQRYDCLR